MSTQNEQPVHDESADEELSQSLAGHADLPEGGEPEAGTSEAGIPEGGEPMIDEPLEEIDGSPVRTENS